MEHSSEVKQAASGFQPAPNCKDDLRYEGFVKAFDGLISSTSDELAKGAPYSENICLLPDGRICIPSAKEEWRFIEKWYPKLPKVGGGVSKTYFRLSDDEVVGIPTPLRNILKNLSMVPLSSVRKRIGDWFKILFYEKYYSDRARAAGLVSQQIDIHLLTIGNVQIPVIVSPSFEKLCKKDGWNIFDNHGAHYSSEEKVLFRDCVRRVEISPHSSSTSYYRFAPELVRNLLNSLARNLLTAIKSAIPLNRETLNIAILPHSPTGNAQDVKDMLFDQEIHTPVLFLYDFCNHGCSTLSAIHEIRGNRFQDALENLKPLIVYMYRVILYVMLDYGYFDYDEEVSKLLSNFVVDRLKEFSENLTSRQICEMYSILPLYDVAFHILIETLGNDPSNIFGSLKEVRVSPQASGVLESPKLTFQSHAPNPSLETQFGKPSISESSDLEADSVASAKSI